MTVKRVIECDNCKEQKLIGDYDHQMYYETEWITLRIGSAQEQPRHFCSSECLKDHVIEECKEGKI